MSRLFSLLLFLCVTASAQKSAPVAGHAARLVDLLKKDYNNTDPINRTETINRDIQEVVGIFSVYITNSATKDFPGDAPAVQSSVFIDYQSALQKQISLSRAFTNSTVSGEAANKIEANLDTLNKKKKLYDDEVYDCNLALLEQIHTYFESKKNTYLSHITEAFKQKYVNAKALKFDGYSQANYTSSIQKANPFFGGDVTFTHIIDGLSRFLAQRIKDELTAYAIEKVQYYLNNPQPESYLNELMVLLPTTTAYLKSFDASQTLSFIDDLKQYIETDLNNLIANAANLKNTPRFKKYIEQNPDLDFAFEAIELLPQLSKIENPIDYFDMLESSRNVQRWADVIPTADDNALRYNISNTVKLSSMLAHSLMIVENSKPKFANTAFMSAYGSEPTFYLLYVGFLNEQNENYYKVSFYKGKKIDLDFLKLMVKLPADDVDATKEQYKLVKSSLTQIAANAEKLYSDYETIRRANNSGEKITPEQVHALANASIDFTENVFHTADTLVSNKNLDILGGADLSGFINKTKPYITTARSVSDIYLELHKRRFASAIIKTMGIPANFNTSQYDGYTAIARSVINSTQNFTSNQDLYNLREFLSFTKVESTPTKKARQMELSIWVDVRLKNADIDATIYPKYRMLYDMINSNSKGDYKQYRKSFAESLSSTKFIKDFTGIDNVKIKRKLQDALQRKGLDKDDEFVKKIEQYIGESLIAFVTDDKEKQEIANANKELVSSYMRIYFPEVFSDVFSFKDDNTIKLVHFVNDVANAKSGEEVEKALNTFALPTGSSAIKEKATRYTAINSYPGLFAGYTTTSVNKGDSYSLGFTAPVGIYYHLGSSNRFTYGLFAPVIDIAAPVRVRLGDNTDELPDLEFKDLFSPGLFLSVGFRNAPLALNIGGQFGPSLKGIKEGAEGLEKTVEENAFYFCVALTIDIPLFTLQARTKN